MRYLHSSKKTKHEIWYQDYLRVWEKENILSEEQVKFRDTFESLSSARERLCATCKIREMKIKSIYNTAKGFIDHEELECSHSIDPRCADGKDCPYYEVDEEALAKVTLARICDSKAVEDEQIPS